jgi:hypothetical protein
MPSDIGKRATVRGWRCAAAMAIALGVAGCADVPPSASPTSASATPVPSANAYSYPTTSSTLFGIKYGYHTGPYDNTGNGPGETGLEGGGG